MCRGVPCGRWHRTVIRPCWRQIWPWRRCGPVVVGMRPVAVVRRSGSVVAGGVRMAGIRFRSMAHVVVAVRTVGSVGTVGTHVHIAAGTVESTVMLRRTLLWPSITIGLRRTLAGTLTGVVVGGPFLRTLGRTVVAAIARTPGRSCMLSGALFASRAVIIPSRIVGLLRVLRSACFYNRTAKRTAQKHNGYKSNYSLHGSTV